MRLVRAPGLRVFTGNQKDLPFKADGRNVFLPLAEKAMAGSPLSFGLLALVLVRVGGPPAPGQGPTGGSVCGPVTDTTGAVLPGVNVTCTSPAQMGIQSAVTNDRGMYRF